MKSILKSKLAFLAFQTPLPLPIAFTKKQRRELKEAKKKFLELRYKKHKLRATRKFVVHQFNPATTNKKILVLHGWMSQSLYMIKIIEKLIEYDYEVIAIDFPCHGDSPGLSLTWYDTVESILMAQEKFGPFKFAVGHSYGGSMILNTMGIAYVHPDIDQYLKIEKAVLIASPTRVQSVINLFSKFMFLSQREVNSFKKLIEQQAKVSIDVVDGAHLQGLGPNKTSFLCLHDPKDKVVPYSDSLYLKEQNANTLIKEKTKIGHMKIIFDDDTIKDMIEFLNNQ